MAETNGADVAVPVMKPLVFSSVKPWVYVKAPKANDAVAFFKAAFGAEELNRVAHPKRKADQEQPLLLSVELKLGNSSILVSDLTDDAPASMKGAAGGCVVSLETDDVEAAKTQAIIAGAISEGEVVGEGDVEGGGGGVVKLKDPFGNLWLISSPPKPLTDEKTLRSCF